MPRLDLIAWACVLAALAVALVALALGADRGYGSATFRAVQFGSQLIAPLWLAWGLTELVAKSVPVRFASKLVTMALTVVTGVVLVTDPLSPTLFSKAWPLASKHYQIIHEVAAQPGRGRDPDRRRDRAGHVAAAVARRPGLAPPGHRRQPRRPSPTY